MESENKGENFRIGTLASLFGLTVRTIRYYEELGLLVSYDRTEGVHRTYAEENIISLERILQLKSLGLSLNEIKEFFDLAEKDESGEKCRALLLRKYSERMETERGIIAEAQGRLEEWNRKTAALEDAERFFDCPGVKCETCEFRKRCSFRLVDYSDAPKEE
jgi:DNA-binding transcriptional MerR regulator